MFASDNGIGGFHNDVLNAFPTDDESALKLVEEIKNRAKGCISSQNYPGAISLYSKAIEICPTESLASKAILYSNRSLCHFSMSSSDLAIEDAGHSIVADPSYLKGYFRAVQGLLLRSRDNDLDTARNHVLYCLSIAPSDKSFIKQLSDVDKKIVQNGIKHERGVDEKKNVAGENTRGSNSSTAVKKNTQSNEGNKAKQGHDSHKSTEGVKDEIEAENEDENENKIRGYKLTSDGRKTTFFNNELDEQTKALIGSIAPQKIETIPGAVCDASSGAGVSGGSAWNAAGTFESVDHSSWATENCEKLLEKTDVTNPSNDLFELVCVKNAVCEGDAQVIGMRGKRKHVCDITATVTWIVKVKEEKQNSSAKAHQSTGSSADMDIVENAKEKIKDEKDEDVELKMIIRDITSDKDFEFEYTHPKISATFTAEHKKVLLNFKKDFESAVTSSLTKFLDLLKTK